MASSVRFATSADGTAIASWQLGSGPPLLMVTLSGGLWPPSALIENRDTRGIYDLLSKNHTVIMYDPRGVGLSQRDVQSYSLEDASSDLVAVADLYGLDSFVAMGQRGTAIPAIHFAATHPSRVSRMVLRDPVLRTGDQVLRPRERALQAMIAADFDFFIDSFSLSQAGWESGRALAEGARRSNNREGFIASFSQMSREDAWPLAPQVQCPTLVIHSRSAAETFPLDVARRIAAKIPLGTLALMEGADIYTRKDTEEWAQLVRGFLDDREALPAHVPPSGTAIVFFADIANSTALTERLGDKSFREKARDLDTALRATIRQYSGTCIDAKTLGDGVLATFTSAAQAIEAALACGKSGAAAALPLHLGLHAGDVIREEDNVFGGAVNIAARISAMSAPGEVLVSDTVRALARTSAGVDFVDRGEKELKGVGEPVRVYEVKRDA